MKAGRILVFAAALILLQTFAVMAQDRQGAESWKKNAIQTRETVQKAIAAAMEANAEEKAVAKSSLEDARLWLGMGDRALKAAETAMRQGQYARASQQFNQAWQYYVKAGSAAVRAGRMAAER